MPERELIVRVVIDDRELAKVAERDAKAIQKLGQSADKSGKDLESFNLRSGKLGAGLRGALSPFGNKSGLLFGSATFVGAAGVTTALKESINAASDLNEQITKSQAVFGDSSKQVLDWSKTTARALGVSQEAALEASGTFGNLFEAQGFSDQRSSELSRNLVKLASDLASFNNIDPGQVLQDLRSGLVGEIEPLRKYGSNLAAARVQQEALTETGKETAKQLTAQELTTARIALLYRDTAAAQGDFARTSSGLANTQRQLSAEVQNLKASIGTFLLPAVTAGTQALVDASDAAGTLIDKLHELGNVKIPVINVPISLGGGKGGGPFGFLGDAAKLAPLLQFSPALFYTALGIEIKHRLEGEKPKATTRLAAEFKKNLGGFFDDALDKAIANVPPPKHRGKGFATGATPEDILGPLIKDVPKKLEEAALAVQVSSPNDHKAIIDALVKERDVLLNALDDPRLKTDQKIKIEKALQGIFSDIDSEKNAITSAAKDAKEKRKKAFDTLQSSLQLKVDSAELTSTFDDDLAALEGVRDGLEKQIKAGIDVQSAKSQLVATLGRIADVKEHKLLDPLDFALNKAGLTKSSRDDLDALIELKGGLEKQIKTGHDVQSAQDRLITVIGQIRDARKQIKQDKSDAILKKQFRELGLSATGEEIVPGVKNLKKQLDEITKKLSATGQVIPSKLTQQLKLARKVLNKEGDNLKKDARDKINELFKTIRGTFDQESRKSITDRRSVQLSDKILAALGFSTDADVTRLAKARPPQFTVPTSARATIGTATTAAGGVNITGPITVVADNPDAFLRELQKRAGRTSGTARGRFPGRSLGLG